MSMRHLIAYGLIVILIAGIAFAVAQWRRAQARRRPHRIGSPRR